MGTLEIVIGAVLLLISLVTIIICMMQEQKIKDPDLEQAWMMAI